MQPDSQPILPGRSLARIADHNSRTMLEALRRNGPQTRSELAALTGLTTPGITIVTRRLLNDGLITQGKRRTPNAQVPSAQFALRPEGAFSIGVRIRAKHLEGVLIDLSGTVRARASAARSGDDGRDLTRLVERLESGDGPTRHAVGIGMTVDPGYEIDIARLREVTAPLSLAVQRDTVAAVIAERTLGQGVPDNGLALVIIDETVRAGLFLHGIPFGGSHGRAGRIGEMRVGADRTPLAKIVSSATCKTAQLRRRTRQWIEQSAAGLLEAIMALTGFIAPGRVLLAGDLPEEVIAQLISQMQAHHESQTVEVSAPALPQLAPARFTREGIVIGAALLPMFERFLPEPWLTDRN